MKVKRLIRDSVFSIFDFSVWPKLASDLGLNIADVGSLQILERIILSQLKTTLPNPLFLDPNLSLNLWAPTKQNQAMALLLDQPSAERDPLASPILVKDWSLEEIKNNLAPAVLTFYYHPREEAALHKKQFLAEIKDYADHQGIDLIVKLIIYTPAHEKFDWVIFQKDQLQAVQELRDLANLLVLQFPHDPLACATLTTELDIPWLLTDDNYQYDDFKNNLREAMENGAAGFVAYSSLVGESKTLKKEDHSPDIEKILNFNTTTFQDRVIELSRIADSFNN